MTWASVRAAMGPRRHTDLYACASTETQLRPWMAPSGDPRGPVRQCWSHGGGAHWPCPRCGSGALCSRKAQLPELPSPSTCLEAGAPRSRPEPLAACCAVFFRRRTLGGSHSTSHTLSSGGSLSLREWNLSWAPGRSVATEPPLHTRPRLGSHTALWSARLRSLAAHPRAGQVRPQRSVRGRRGQGRRGAAVRAGEARTCTRQYCDGLRTKRLTRKQFSDKMAQNAPGGWGGG